MAFPDFEDTQGPSVQTPSIWAESGREVTPSDVMNALRDLKDRFDNFEREIGSHKEAFVVDDLGKPDFHGHRKSHLKIDSNSKLMDSYKTDVTKQILAVAIAFAIGLFGSGFKDYLAGPPAKLKPASVQTEK